MDIPYAKARAVVLPPLVERVVVREHVRDHRGAGLGTHAGEAPDLEVKVHLLLAKVAP